jgi:hypothetical protein
MCEVVAIWNNLYNENGDFLQNLHVYWLSIKLEAKKIYPN